MKITQAEQKVEYLKRDIIAKREDLNDDSCGGWDWDTAVAYEEWIRCLESVVSIMEKSEDDFNKMLEDELVFGDE